MPIQKGLKRANQLFCCIVSLFLLACNKPGPQLVEMKQLKNYASGSGLVFFNDHLYVIGDDSNDIIKTDSQFNEIDRIKLFTSGQQRIPKEIKADLESIVLTGLNKRKMFLLMGSGSLTPYRDLCWIVDPRNKEKKEYRLDTFYNRLRNEGLRDLNIEGAAATPAGIVLANRGNKSFPKNYLVFVSNRFWEKQEIATIRIVKTGTNADTSAFAGISGLDYSYTSDQLFLTVSTENTYSSYADGVIGKSYVWIINDISSKRRLDAMNPDRIIDLEEIDSRFKGHKIESVCIVADTKNEKELVLVADDDKGGTVLFRLKL
jgi:hypothetical protein